MKRFVKSRNILLMDPDGLVRESMTLFLEGMGRQVTTSATAKEALRSQKQQLVNSLNHSNEKEETL